MLGQGGPGYFFRDPQTEGRGVPYFFERGGWGVEHFFES
jgi:hypothetical protein